MINVNRYNIDNFQLVNRLLPWWLRGRKTVLLLNAVSYPIVALHKVWQAWALERLIEAKTTSQPKSLSWYLDYKLKSHFEDINDHFSIDLSVIGSKCYIFHTLEWRKALEYTQPARFLKTGRDCTITLFNTDENDTVYKGSDLYSFNLSESEKVLPFFQYTATEEPENDGTIYTYYRGETQIDVNCIIIYAPIIANRSDYTLQGYKADILKLAYKYITNFQNIIIIYDERIID